MTIVLRKTLIFLALICSPVFARPLHHHKRESRTNEPTRAWLGKYEAKPDGSRDSEVRTYGFQTSNPLSGAKGHFRYNRESNRYSSEMNGRLSNNFQRDSRNAADESDDFGEEYSFPVQRRVSDQDSQEIVEDQSLSRGQDKQKRSSVPVEEEKYFEGGDSKYDGMSDPDEAYLEQDDRGPGYVNQADALSDNGDSVNADSFDAIEEGEAVEGKTDDVSADGKSDDNSARDGVDDAEDGVAVEVGEDTKSIYSGSPREQGTQRNRRNSRNSAMRDGNSFYGMRRSAAQRNQDREENQSEEEERDGADYNSENLAVDFPYEKGYLKVNGLDYDLGSE